MGILGSVGNCGVFQNVPTKSVIKLSLAGRGNDKAHGYGLPHRYHGRTGGLSLALGFLGSFFFFWPLGLHMGYIWVSIPYAGCG